MNFLAHIFLSGDDHDILLGNFMADQIKGKDLSRFSPQVRNGIILHRTIDHFTDTHEISGKAREILRPSMGKYAGVVLDVFYDHFLAIKWNDHHDLSLGQFTKRAYTLIESRKAEMPERTQYLFHYMSEQDWLTSYATIDGIDRALKGLSARVSHENRMAHTKDELTKYYDDLSDNFDEYFPLIKERCRVFLDRSKSV